MSYSDLLLVSTFIVAIFVYVARSRPRNFPAGPLRLPIVGSFFSVGVPPHLGLRKLRAKYGDIFSLYCGNYPAIVLNNLDLIRDAFRDDRFCARPPLRPFLERSWGVHKGVVFGTGKDWMEQRNFILRVFRKFGFGKRKMEDVILKTVLELIQEFKKTDGKLTSVNNHFHTAILNTLWDIVARKRFAYDDPELHELNRCTSMAVRLRSVDASSVMPQILFFQPLFTKLFPKWTGWNKFLADSEAILPLLQKYIDSHKESYNENNLRDIIDVYLKKIYSESNEDSTFYKDEGERQLLIVLLDLLVAGGETASISLTWAILHLTTHPTIQEKLIKEIDEVIGANRLPSLSDKRNLPYLEAFINEAFRMATIGAMSIIHSVSEDIPNFHGYKLPKGTIVMGNLWEIHHDQKIWGDPENFRPERFLESNSNMFAKLNVFSKGKRICPGEGLVRDELFLLIAGVLQEFTFSRNESEPLPCLDPTKAATLQRHTSQVYIKPRK